MLQDALLIATLIYAAIYDYKHRIVPKYIYYIIGFLGLFSISLQSFMWAAIIFILCLTVAVITNALGGGDVKLLALCAFIMQVEILPALLIGLLIYVCFSTVYCKAKKLPVMKGTKLPLVPFITIGCIALKGLMLL